MVPTVLQYECEGQSQLTADVDSVSEALAWLKVEHPNLYRNVCQETNSVRPHVNLFINDQLVCKTNGLETRFSQNDELHILPSVSGG